MNASVASAGLLTAVSPIDYDVLIVGAGISGIGMAVHLQNECPAKRFAVLERRADLGGTWDLFRYPGVRSDSDMHTLGFDFEPWTHENAIAGGSAILDYLNRIVDERGVRHRMRFGHKVVAADWDGATARWTLAVEDAGGTPSTLTTRFLYLGSGYYDHDEPYDARLPGADEFGGELIHPQFWPEGFDHAGKRVVVIGSGATAATIVPAMAEAADHVTMLQRTPTWYAIRPTKDRLANALRKVLPERWAYAITRFKSIRFQEMVFRKARAEPRKVAHFLSRQVREALGPRYDEAAFTPPYNPWEQRLCLVPDGDLFAAINAGKASVVTDRIERLDHDGVKLESGKRLDADVIVTATGLKLALAGKIAVSVDGVPVRWNTRFYYRNAMFSNVPNLVGVFGYLNASWTLRADLVARYACRLINHMDAIGADVAVPALPAGVELEEDNVLDFSSGYIQRSLHELPRSATALPWRLNQDYLRDRRYMLHDPIDDGVLTFAEVPLAAARRVPELKAAE